MISYNIRFGVIFPDGNFWEEKKGPKDEKCYLKAVWKELRRVVQMLNDHRPQQTIDMNKKLRCDSMIPRLAYLWQVDACKELPHGLDHSKSTLARGSLLIGSWTDYLTGVCACL